MRTSTFTCLAALSALTVAACADREPQTEMEGEADSVQTEPMAEVTVPFARYDADGDQYLADTEWPLWWGDARIITVWDSDGETGLSPSELADATVRLWDGDGDGAVDESEWREGSSRWFGTDLEDATYADWDRDGDGYLDAEEVAQDFETNALYGNIDTDDDGVVDDQELSDWFFDVVDVNRDGKVDASEWDWGVEQGYTR
ncbi:MAG TPA: hypothetical protein VE173_12060 [Longimicrobiales bacterium]|nr:hypothetical protein [Longimicrobiales bacterium]